MLFHAPSLLRQKYEVFKLKTNSVIHQKIACIMKSQNLSKINVQLTCSCVCFGTQCSDRCGFAPVPRMLNCMESSAAETATFHAANWSPSQRKIQPAKQCTNNETTKTIYYTKLLKLYIFNFSLYNKVYLTVQVLNLKITIKCLHLSL